MEKCDSKNHPGTGSAAAQFATDRFGFTCGILYCLRSSLLEETTTQTHRNDSALSAARPLAPTIGRRRWGIAWLLSFGVLVIYFDRVNLSVSQDALRAAFGISPLMFGYLSSAYSWTYAACQLPSGLLLDRFGVRLIGRISTFLWSVASFGAAVSSGIRGFFFVLFFLGIGQPHT